MTEIELGGYQFKGICRIIPELNEEGNPVEYMPQSEYDNTRDIPLNARAETDHFANSTYQTESMNQVFMSFSLITV
jgi:hypothetical protein